VIARVVAVACLVAPLAGCAAAEAKVAYLANQRYAACGPSHAIDIDRYASSRPHVLIGKIVGRQPADPWTGKADGRECIGEMKNVARQVGGDAILELQITRAGWGQANAGSVTAQGYIVRWD